MSKQMVDAIRIRRKGGFSLVTVLIVGMLATIWIAATSTSMLQVYRDTSQSRYTTSVLTAAESGIDYAVAALNDPVMRPSFDVENYEYGKTREVTPSVTPAKWGAPADGINVKVTVFNLAPTSNSLLYDANLAPPKEQLKGQNWSAITADANNPYRIVKATASNGMIAKTVTVALRGKYSGPNQLSSNGPVNYNPQNQAPYFTRGIQASGEIKLGSNAETRGYDSVTRKAFTSGAYNLGGDIASNTKISLSGDAIVGGSLDVPFSPAVGRAVENLGQAQVNRYLTTNGSQSGFSDSSPINVLGASSSEFMPQPGRTNILVNQSSLQTQFVPAPPAPASSSGSGASLNYSSRTFVPRADLSISSVSSAQGATITPSFFSNTNQPTRLFIASDSTDPVVLNGNVNQNGSPADFQIFYNGTGTLTIRSPEFRGSIYAPNATVLLGGLNGSNQTLFYGAVTAKQIGGKFDSNGLAPATNLKFYSDRALLNPSEFSGSALQNNRHASLTYDPSQYGYPPKSFDVITYLESRSNH